MLGSMQRTALALFFVLSGLPACSSTSTPAAVDTGSGSLDSTVPHDSAGSDATAVDAVVPEDTGSADTAAADTAATDTGAPAQDTGTGTAPGECAPGPCPMECFRPYRCVTVCGGPIQECGCCPCAAGSIDTITCPSSS